LNDPKFPGRQLAGITFNPHPGTVLLCDFDAGGFTPPGYKQVAPYELFLRKLSIIS
jgi:hypothetical protein